MWNVFDKGEDWLKNQQGSYFQVVSDNQKNNEQKQGVAYLTARQQQVINQFVFIIILRYNYNLIQLLGTQYSKSKLNQIVLFFNYFILLLELKYINLNSIQLILEELIRILDLCRVYNCFSCELRTFAYRIKIQIIEQLKSCLKYLQTILFRCCHRKIHLEFIKPIIKIQIHLKESFGQIILINSTDLMFPKPNKSTAQKTADYFMTVEAGDIALFDIFEEAILMFGFTRVGKTASCHYLTNSTLKAVNKNGDLIYHMACQKYPNAFIGHTGDSETEIPNIFEFSFKDQTTQKIVKIALLDQPGYGDTYGFHRILSNGYFHYRSFSKTPKLKFILAFNKNEMKGTAKYFRETVLKFINSFIDYQKIKQEIMQATTFLITQVEPISTLQNIIAIIQDLKSHVKNLTEDEGALYTELIQHMLTNKKIFFIKKPNSVNQQTPNNTMLQQIYDKTKFWVRNITGNVVDMSNIRFSVASQILSQLRSRNKLFQQDYAHFMNFVNDRINNTFKNDQNSLLNLVTVLNQDSVADINQHSFLQFMSSFNAKYYKFDKRYNEKRKIRESSLFKSSELNDSMNQIKPNLNAKKQEQIQRQKQIRSAYFVKKFRVLQTIIQKIQRITDNNQKDRTIYELQATSIHFIEMFKKMSILRWQRTDPENIIYKYTYVILRMIQQCKIITLILFNRQQDLHQFQDYNSVKKIGFPDIYRLIADNFSQVEIRIDQRKQKFCQNLNVTTLDNINQEIIAFFQSCPQSPNVTHKIIVLLIKYAQMLTNKKKVVSDEQKRFVAEKLYNYRDKSLKFIQNISKEDSSNKDLRKQAVSQIFRLSYPLASILASYTHYDIARAIYQSINNAEMTFKMFQQDLKVRENDIEGSRRLLIQYGNYASITHRKQLAMKCYQQAYSKSFEYDELTEVSNAILKLYQAEKLETEQVYIKNFFNENFCLELPPGIDQKITTIFCPDELPPID